MHKMLLIQGVEVMCTQNNGLNDFCSRLNNCRDAMDMAKQHFGIPLVLSPENLSNPDLDELSGMTYLSYFMKVDSPGFNATLKWVREQIPSQNVKNFQVNYKQ